MILVGGNYGCVELGYIIGARCIFWEITHMRGGLGDGSGVDGTFSGCLFSLWKLTHYWRKTARNRLGMPTNDDHDVKMEFHIIAQ